MEKQNVIWIVKQYIEQNGFGGLFSPHYECACEKEDLAPCGEIQSTCEPGYRSACPDECGDHAFHISRDRGMSYDTA